MDSPQQTEHHRRSPPQPSSLDRRTLLKMAGASLALAGLVGCKGEEDEAALPYVVDPEKVTPGVAKWYASAVTLSGYAQPIVGKTFTGRPVKIEGNPDHPASEGKSVSFTQASLLSLYDPNRSRLPLLQGQPSTFAAFSGVLAETAARLDRTGGAGLCLVIGPSTSATLRRQVEALAARWPRSRRIALIPTEGASSGTTERVYGRRLVPQQDFGSAEVIVSLDDDFLGPGPHQTRHAMLFGRRRQARKSRSGRSLLMVAEPVPSTTGSVADYRLAASTDMLDRMAAALATRAGVNLPAPDGGELSPEASDWIDRAARLLLSAKGRSLVTVGAYQPDRLHHLAILINEALGNLGKTLTYIDDPVFLGGDPQQVWTSLGAGLVNGEVDTLVCIDANPVYHAPGDLRLGDLFRKLRLVVHAGLYVDETAQLAHWHVPLQHDLETWSDARATDGTDCIIQPLVRPFFDVASRHAILDRLGGEQNDDLSLVQQTWRARWANAFDHRWRQALLKGFVADSAPAAIVPTVVARDPPSAVGSTQGLKVVIRPDAGVWDGSFSENGWMQETPRPLSKIVWDNVVQIAPELAKREGLANGDEVSVVVGEESVTGAAWVTAGQDPETVSLTLGYGRRIKGGISAGAGFDTAPLRAIAAPFEREGARLSKTGGRQKIATTQPEQDMGEHDFSRVVTVKKSEEVKSKPPSFYPDQPTGDPSWGMTIDLDLCIGCNACVTACQAENNIPVVGRDLVAEGREMHWMRVDHYLVDRPDEPASRFQPVPCMHCEQAPCEMGCPVNAAVHSADGLNLQVYNRCIGTRTCSSFCPYKVRRFNWFDFTSEDPESIKAMRNPDVTVRSRGVMEKCTYCVQRIAQVRITADKEGRAIQDGELVTACQQACPTQAIIFGNVADPGSAVSRSKSSPRNYALLEEANTRPRTTYLARISGDVAEEGGEP